MMCEPWAPSHPPPACSSNHHPRHFGLWTRNECHVLHEYRELGFSNQPLRNGTRKKSSVRSPSKLMSYQVHNARPFSGLEHRTCLAGIPRKGLFAQDVTAT
jgi:hypothetical protein